jgi:hypothetical protein
MTGPEPADTDFEYAATPRQRGGGPDLAVYADSASVRAMLRQDVLASGNRLTRAAGLDVLFASDTRPLEDIVLIDCGHTDFGTLTALAEVDLRAARSGAQLIISTTRSALDDVFAFVDQSRAQFLVEPSAAERSLALGEALALARVGRVCELSETDRVMILRLTEQVGQIAGRIEKLTGASPPPPGEFEPGGAPSPDPVLVRRVIRNRQLRGRMLDPALFADPAWDMLLDLTAARAERVRVSVTSLCIAACVPPTTALRWIGQMEKAGLFERTCDRSDRRRAFIDLTDKAAEAMARYFAAVTEAGVMVV